MREPEFIQKGDFKTVIWRTKKATGQSENELTVQVKVADNKEDNEYHTGQATDHVRGQVAEPIKRVVLVMEDNLKL